MTRVLIVEDNDAVRASIRDFMNAADINVDEANDGAMALKFLRTKPYDAVITDIWMPVMDGVDLLNTMRRDFQETPVVAISGGAPGRAAIDYSIALARTCGADAVFHKPFDNRHLVAKVKELIGSTV